MTADELRAFEADIAREFGAGRIRAPVHLSGGNEDQLIEIFKQVRPQDWCLSTWRSHYHALLKGIAPAELKAQIMAGRSMFISSPEHRFLSSAIMGGMLPIACALAYAGERVWCFIGDMCASIGAFEDAKKFCHGHDLKGINFVVEDNGLSTNTPTLAAWGHGEEHARYTRHRVQRYDYQRIYPHYQYWPGQDGF